MQPTEQMYPGVNINREVRFNHFFEYYENGKWTATGDWERPWQDWETLDESLDHGRIVLWHTHRSEILKPFTVIRQTTYDMETGEMRQKYRVITNGVNVHKTFQQQYDGDESQCTYTHTYETAELTKILERQICDTLTFTNYLGHEYPLAHDEPLIFPAFGNYYKSKFDAPQMVRINETVTFPSASNAVDLVSPPSPLHDPYFANGSTLTVTAPTGTVATFDIDKDAADIKFSIAGEYKMRYHFNAFVKQYNRDDIEISTASEWTITVVADKLQKPSYTITSVLNRILDVGVTHRAGVAPMFHLAADTAAKYANVAAPEFYITRSTLFEALLQVGKYIHAIPRLNWNDETGQPDTITFDELGGSTPYTLPWVFGAHDESYNCDDYCGALDSTVDNLLNSRDLVQGAITEPFAGGWTTVRTDDGNLKIDEESAIIRLNYPAYRITKLEMKIDGGEYDITPFLFERAEYETLSSCEGTYPYVKSFALCYAQGDNKITGLSFKAKKIENNVANFFRNTALGNIIAGVTGKNDFATKDDDEEFVLGTRYRDVAFRVTYIPVISARVVTKKQERGAFPEANRLIFQQGANTVETELIGENLRGNIAKMGNKTVTYTYNVESLGRIPKCGDVIDGMYVISVAEEVQLDYIRITVTMTKDYNKLAEYFSLQNNYRLFDVSEKQSVDRYINYGEDIVIGDDATGETSAWTKEAETALKSTLSQDESYHATAVKVKTPQGEFLLPCISTAIGNSLAFTFRFMDNYGAGYSAEKTAGLIPVQHLEPYGDDYGEMDELAFMICRSIGGGFSLEKANQLPKSTDTEFVDKPIYNCLYRGLTVRKDSRENIVATIQYHFRSNRKGIVIGSQITQNNVMITEPNAAKRAVLYYLPKPLNKFSSQVDLEGAEKASGYTIKGAGLLGNRGLKIIIPEPTNNWKAWALVDESCGKLYFGENKDIYAGEAPTCYMNFVGNTDKITDLYQQ